MTRHISLLLATGLLILSATAPVTARRTQLLNTTFTVEPGTYRFWQFHVGDAIPGGVLGRFRAQGGSGNDIEVLVLDQDQFENWQNGHQTPAFYASGRITVSRFAVKLPPGIFYVVFNNKFSAVSNKVVSASIGVDDGYR